MNIQLTSNIQGRIKKIREGVVYQAWTAFVPELIQNAQRAKAKNIIITTRPGYFCIEDDGRGCPDPKLVFTLDLSGWDSDVYAPFGEGFSSLFVVADLIIVRSRDWQATFDLKKALETGQFDNIEVEYSTQQKGFRAEIFFDSQKFDIWAVEKEVERIGTMAPVDVYLNGTHLDKRNVSYEPFSIQKRLAHFGEAILAPEDGYGPLEIIYEGRPVRDMYFKGLRGILALRPGSVTLKAPDRRDIVHDEKKDALEAKLKAAAAELMLEIVQAHPDLIDKYQHSIRDFLTPATYIKHLSFGLFKAKQQMEKKQHTFKLADLMSQAAVQEYAATVPILSKTQETEDSSLEEIKEIRKLVKKGQIFYRLIDEEELKELQAKAEYLGFVVLVVNELRAKALEYLHVPHLMTMQHDVREAYEYARIGAFNKKEQRLCQLLAPICQHFHVRTDLITFADIKQEVITRVNGKVAHKVRLYPYGVCDKNQNKILLSRKMLSIRNLSVSYGAALGTARDLKALMHILPTVSHELAHYLYNTVDNTLEMYKRQEQILREAIDIIEKAF